MEPEGRGKYPITKEAGDQDFRRVACWKMTFIGSFVFQMGLERQENELYPLICVILYLAAVVLKDLSGKYNHVG